MSTTKTAEKAPKKIAKINPLTPAQIGEMALYDAWMKSNGLTDQQMAEFHGLHPSTVFKLRKNISTNNIGNMMQRIRAGIAKAEATLASAQSYSAQTFFESASYLRLRDAVEASLGLAELGECERGVLLLGHCGMGKTEAIKQLVRWHDKDGDKVSVRISARPSWGKNYKAILRRMAVALQLKGWTDDKEPRVSTDVLENQILRLLQTRRRLIAFEEVDPTVGEQFLRLLKMILNETPATLVIAAVPSYARQIAKLRDGDESSQLMRRLRQIELAADEELIGEFLAISHGGDPHLAEAAETIAAAVSVPKSGGLTLLKTALPFLKDLSPDSVEKALKTAKEQFEIAA